MALENTITETVVPAERFDPAEADSYHKEYAIYGHTEANTVYFFDTMDECFNKAKMLKHAQSGDSHPEVAIYQRGMGCVVIQEPGD